MLCIDLNPVQLQAQMARIISLAQLPPQHLPIISRLLSYDTLILAQLNFPFTLDPRYFHMQGMAEPYLSRVFPHPRSMNLHFLRIQHFLS
ncbi:hypothetical protein FGO68_gene16638 [Halteria grandinella]|uniref:Uncharacterized protein n=1 Tax=Halteria grandinella TaxID=5974 RepID=A0A8J8NYR3_HALGN|nr:hypothetical protein FGO68_gene16638 [Halteria grandinella]